MKEMRACKKPSATAQIKPSATASVIPSVPTPSAASAATPEKAFRKTSGTALIMILVMIALLLFSVQTHSYGASNATTSTSTGAFAGKPAQLITSENELKEQAAKESELKKSITSETINRSKLLAQKRAELKDIRKKRDDALNKEKADIKARRDKQAEIVKTYKGQRASVKKANSPVALTALDVVIALAEGKLSDLRMQYDTINKKLSQSYADYKNTYQKLTNIDLELKKMLDGVAAYEQSIKLRKAEQKKLQTEYNKNVKAKDFSAAQKIVNSQLTEQREINGTYTKILEIRKKFKSEYYSKLVNIKL